MSESFVATSDGLMTGVQPAPTPDEIRARQAAFHQQGNQPGQPVQPQQQPSSFFTQADLDAARENARREEKDKLYEQLEAVKGELTAIRADQAAKEAEAAAARQAAEEAERQARESQMNGKQLAEQVRSELTSKLDDLQQQLALKDATFERERQYNAIQDYRRQQLAVHGGEIIPNLHDYVQGSTQEEIDASISDLKNRSAEIFGAAAAQQQQQFSAMRGVAPTGMPPAAGPVDNESFERQFTPEQIKNMSDAEYARYRPQILNWTSRQHRGQGR